MLGVVPPLPLSVWHDAELNLGPPFAFFFEQQQHRVS